jgi:nucleotide-binding universal stress UspA family protein
MKSILVPVEEHTLLHPVLDTALLLGRTFDSYIEGFALGLNLPMAMPIDIAIGIPSLLDPTTRREMTDAARRHFETFMVAQNVPPATAGSAGLGFGWHESEMMNDAFLGSHGRAFDIVVVGRPGGGTNHPRLATAEAAMFESGRPLLIAPPESPRSLHDHIAIAWNFSTETARAVALAMPLLQRAGQVTVITIDGWGGSGPGGADVVRALKRHGIPASVRNAPGPAGRAGEIVLSTCASIGCNLLVKGAYTQSRLRQMILGGATSHILANATLPVLMAH